MESELIETLNLVGYSGNLLVLEELQFALKDGIKSKDYRQLIVWLAGEIKILGGLEELVQEEDDVNTFMVELSGFLKELRCPHTDLITGHVSDRLQTVESRTLLLDFLLTEHMGLKMYNVNKPKDTSKVITIHETPIAAALKDLTIALSMGKPPDNISPKILFDKMASRLDEVTKKAGPKRLGKALFNPNKNLTMDQWKLLEQIQQDLDEEYDIRRKMMLARLDVTIQSFQWSDRLKGKEDLIAKEYTPRRKKLDEFQVGGEDTNISALIAARESLAIIEKTSNSSVRKFTKSKIQRLIIGQVPDRGGRAHEHIPPPPEMPSWIQRGGGAGGGRGGGRGGHGGGRGGGGDRGGRGRGGGTPWIQPPQNFQQNQSSGHQQQNYSQQSQNFNYQQQQQSGGSNQYDNRGGGGRVQGGWSQTRGGYDNSQNQNRGGGGGQGTGGRDYNQGQGYSSFNRGGGSGGGGGGRGGGRSNYNRGGGGGGNRY